MSTYTKLYITGTSLYAVGTVLAYLFASSPGCCEGKTHSTVKIEKETLSMSTYGHIDAKTLKNLIDTKTPMVILDARGQNWDDGRRIPGAKSLPAGSSSEDIAQSVPDKNALIVVYCGSYECPASQYLVEKLVSEGYTHILEYSGGIKEWVEKANYPIEKES